MKAYDAKVLLEVPNVEVWGYTYTKGRCSIFFDADMAVEWARSNKDYFIELAVAKKEGAARFSNEWVTCPISKEA